VCAYRKIIQNGSQDWFASASRYKVLDRPRDPQEKIRIRHLNGGPEANALDRQAFPYNPQVSGFLFI
jgi:hypothetical protein